MGFRARPGRKPPGTNSSVIPSARKGPGTPAHAGEPRHRHRDRFPRRDWDQELSHRPEVSILPRASGAFSGNAAWAPGSIFPGGLGRGHPAMGSGRERRTPSRCPSATPGMVQIGGERRGEGLSPGGKEWPGGIPSCWGGLGRRGCCSKRGAALLGAAGKPCAAGAHVGTGWPLHGTCSIGDAFWGALERGSCSGTGACTSDSALLGWVMLRGRAA